MEMTPREAFDASLEDFRGFQAEIAKFGLTWLQKLSAHMKPSVGAQQLREIADQEAGRLMRYIILRVGAGIPESNTRAKALPALFYRGLFPETGPAETLAQIADYRADGPVAFSRCLFKRSGMIPPLELQVLAAKQTKGQMDDYEKIFRLFAEGLAEKHGLPDTLDAEPAQRGRPVAVDEIEEISPLRGAESATDQRAAWELLSSAMRSGAVDIGVRENHANNLLANTSSTGAGLNYIFSVGCLAVPVVFYFGGWKIGLAVLVPLALIYQLIGVMARSRVRRFAMEDRILFHTMIETDSIRPRINPNAFPPPFTAEELARLIDQSRPR
ncbi:MAG: hypothetical protein AAB074_12950 [Planctomycetota bacterium]